jgi:hypothetical protein
MFQSDFNGFLYALHPHEIKHVMIRQLTCIHACLHGIERVFGWSNSNTGLDVGLAQYGTVRAVVRCALSRTSVA